MNPVHPSSLIRAARKRIMRHIHPLFTGGEMVTYVVLWKFTDEGARNIKHTTGRSEVFRAQAETLGVRVKDYYWTLGGYDGVVILEAADDESVARLIFLVCSLGSVHAEALRAFTQEEIDRVLS